MTQKNWKEIQALPKEQRPNFYFWRNKALKFFGIGSRTRGFVIHHLRDTEEQRNFNDAYYERWGFDFDDQMKYAVKMTVEEHQKYHRKGQTKETSESIRKAIETRAKTYENNPKIKEQLRQAIYKRIENGTGPGSYLTQESYERIAKKNSINFSGVKNPFYNKCHTERTKEIISRKNKGKKRTEEQRKQMSKNRKGEKNPSWGKFGKDSHGYGKHNLTEKGRQNIIESKVRQAIRYRESLPKVLEFNLDTFETKLFENPNKYLKSNSLLEWGRLKWVLPRNLDLVKRGKPSQVLVPTVENKWATYWTDDIKDGDTFLKLLKLQKLRNLLKEENLHKKQLKQFPITAGDSLNKFYEKNPIIFSMIGMSKDQKTSYWLSKN
jgi:hypothetical protein